MNNSSYIIFKISGIKHSGFENSFAFENNAVCEISGDQFIKKIEVSTDISSATFYLHDSLEITSESILQIVDYLYKYLGSMMISLLKNSLNYSSALLKPTICLLTICISGIDKTRMLLRDQIQLHDSLAVQHKLGNENDVLKKWIQDVNISNYTSKNDKYDVLFLLLQGNNMVQKYMAMYAYLMSLVKNINSQTKESQKQVVQYITKNCSRVGINLILLPSTRPGANSTDTEDQFTYLRNQIGHPTVTNIPVNINEDSVNGLASIICCAIEDTPS